MFIAALFTTAREDEWMKKMWYFLCVCVCVCVCVYTMKYSSAIKKNERMPFATTWMDLENMLSEVDRERQISWYHLYVESFIKKKDTN